MATWDSPSSWPCHSLSLSWNMSSSWPLLHSSYKSLLLNLCLTVLGLGTRRAQESCFIAEFGIVTSSILAWFLYPFRLIKLMVEVQLHHTVLWFYLKILHFNRGSSSLLKGTCSLSLSSSLFSLSISSLQPSISSHSLGSFSLLQSISSLPKDVSSVHCLCCRYRLWGNLCSPWGEATAPLAPLPSGAWHTMLRIGRIPVICQNTEPAKKKRANYRDTVKGQFLFIKSIQKIID